MPIQLNTNVIPTPGQSNVTTQSVETLKTVETKAKELAKDVAKVLAGASINVTAPTTGADQATEKKTTGSTSTPALDNPGDVKQIEANLEKLLAYLQLDNEERQAEMAKDRIEINKDSFKTEHDNRSKKIQKTLDDMDKAEKSRKASRIFGWLMAALAVVVAVIACVATGGLAVGAVVGALVAIGMQVMNETGVMDKLTQGIAELLEKTGMSKQAAQILAALIITAAVIAVSAGAGAGAGALATKIGLAAKLSTGVSEAVKAGAEVAKAVVSIASRVVQAGSIIVGGTAAALSFNAGMSQAETTETEKFLAALRQRMEESEEELEQLLQAIQNSISNTAELLASATDTSAEIARNIGQMA